MGQAAPAEVTAPARTSRLLGAVEAERCRRDAHTFIFDTGVLQTKDEHDTLQPVKRVPELPYLRVLLDFLLVSGRLIEPARATYAAQAGVPPRGSNTSSAPASCFWKRAAMCSPRT